MNHFHKPDYWRSVAALGCFLILGAGGLRAKTIEATGVLGNSGEQGDTLVRFGKKSGAGTGVVFDAKGTLWSGAGDGELNRYAVDGRRIATYRTAPFAGRASRDTIVLADDRLLMKFGKKLFALPLDAGPEVEPTPLDVEAERLSFSMHKGWAAAAVGARVFWVNPAGETRDIGEAPGIVEDLEVGPDGGVYARILGRMLRVDGAAAQQENISQTVPGERPQWLNGYWYGHSWHGTIRRFNRGLEMDPGVVLGGNSGSFIGYVPGNYDLGNGTGMAWLGRNLFAVAGTTGTVQLLEWIPEDKRFDLIRRIGSVRNCMALGLDGEGRVWYHGGTWAWTDGPDVCLRDGIPGAGAPDGDAGQGSEAFAAVVLPNDVLLAPIAAKNGNGTLFGGVLTTRVNRTPSEVIPKDGVACAVVNWKKRSGLLMVNKTGAGVVMLVDQNSGKPQTKAGDVRLESTTPLKSLSSLASLDGENLWAAADGYIVEFARSGDAWKETRRWNSWAPDEASRFGTKLEVSMSDGRLWVADTERHRVLAFDAATGKLLAQTGKPDQKGSDLLSFDSPGVLAANGKRAVVFDSGNQRVIKLEWKD